MKTIDVTAQEKCRLDVLLSQTQLTRSHAQKLIHGGAVTVNGKVVQKVSAEVTPGAEVRVQLPEEVPLEVPPQDIDVDVVYQDEWLAVINKPQGLTVHPANNVNTDTLVNALLFHIKDLSGINGVLRPGIVHRLDKDTSGLLVVAKNDAAHVELQRQIQTKQCRRIYVALLEGVLKQESGIVDQPIGRSTADRKKMAVRADGRSAQTLFSVIKRYRHYTLVRFELKTGRTHQIRVHAKFLGHPVVGDKAYGTKSNRWNLAGQLLHAQSITFTHPHSGENMTFTAPLPSYFAKVLDVLDKTDEAK